MNKEEKESKEPNILLIFMLYSKFLVCVCGGGGGGDMPMHPPDFWPCLNYPFPQQYKLHQHPHSNPYFKPNPNYRGIIIILGLLLQYPDIDVI